MSSAADDPVASAGGRSELLECLDVLVGRLADLAAEVGDAAARGTPGAYVLAEEAAAARHRRPLVPQPPLATAGRLLQLGTTFGLSSLELDLVLIAAAADLDERAELLFGYVHDDLTRRRASCGLALRLCGVALDDVRAHQVLSPAARLLDGALVVVDEPSAPRPRRALRCPDRVVGWLAGVDEPQPPVDRLLTTPPPTPGEAAGRLAAAMTSGLRFHFLHARPGTDPCGAAAAAAQLLGVRTLTVDLRRLRACDEPDEVAAACLREARLQDAILVAGPVEGLLEAGGSLELWADSDWPTVLHGADSWDPRWAAPAPKVAVAPPVQAGRAQLWRDALGPQALSTEAVAEATASFRLTGGEIAVAAASALAEAAAEGRPVSPEDLRRSARARNTGALDRLARRQEPRVSFDDLVLPDDTAEKLHELVHRSHHRDLVYGQWSLGHQDQEAAGLTALFAGPSGTGKTMAAEVVAGALGLDLYVVDMSGVVDKFIGETEKNLERVFDEAERVNGVLLFDEADALFGKRSEVKDAHDRYANLETAYLLQRMEAFSGVAILTTNLRSNLDDAFARRLDAIVTFPMPDEAQRLSLWRRFLGPKVPLAEDVDLDFCARQFQLSGGNIRNIAVAAAFLAADAGPPVQMADVIRGIEREYEKLGRLRSGAEFGVYAGLLNEPGGR